jgi:hypothetical protein
MERPRVLKVKRPVTKKRQETDEKEQASDKKEPQETEPQETESQETEPLDEKGQQETEPQETEPQETEPQETPSPMYHQRIQQVVDRMSMLTRPDIILLKNPTVIQWLYGDTSFLPPILSKNKTTDTTLRKAQEDVWGQEMMRLRRPDLKLEKQWTNRFGEYLCEEILLLHGHQPYKPMKRNHYQPDVEVAAAIWEAKAQTYYTEGTAGEKILGCPFKYAEIPDLYSKPLHILCIGGAEKLSREKYGNLPGPKQTPQKERILQTFRDLRIEYVGYTDLLEQWIESSP